MAVEVEGTIWMLRDGRSVFMRDALIGACLIEESVGDSGAGLICGDALAPLGGAGNDEDISLDGNAAIKEGSCAAETKISSFGRTGTDCLCLLTCRGPDGDSCCLVDLIV